MKKLIFILFCLIALTIVFLVIVLVLNKDSGRGALQITSSPKSRVYLNGDYIGDSPLCKCDTAQMLPVGEYDIKLIPTISELSPFEQKVKIGSGVLTAIDRTFGSSASSGSIIGLTPTTDKKATELLVISFPNDAEVFLDNNDMGKTPLVLKNVTPSDHEIKLTKDSYADKVVKVRTAQGFLLEAQIFMGVGENIPPASLSASPTPSASQVEILSTPTGFLRVRQNADATSLEVGRVNPGEKYDLISEKTGWFQIKLKDGKAGWISSDYASKK